MNNFDRFCDNGRENICLGFILIGSFLFFFYFFLKDMNYDGCVYLKFGGIFIFVSYLECGFDEVWNVIYFYIVGFEKVMKL